MRHLALCLIVLIGSCPVLASPHECRVPLHDGKLQTADLSRGLLSRVHVSRVTLNLGTIDLNGWRGATFLRALDASLGDGCRVEVTPDALVLHFDPQKLPHSVDDAK